MKKRDKDYKSSIEKALEDPIRKSQYLKQVEQLFKGPKGDPNHAKDLQRLHDSYGTKSFRSKAKAYIKKYGLPDEYGALILLLNLTSEKRIVIDAMEKLIEMKEKLSTHELKGLKSKLRTLSLTSKDIELSEIAEEFLGEL